MKREGFTVAGVDLCGPHPVWWTREDYLRMAEAGLFEARRVERLEGEIIERAPQSSLHAETVTLVDDALRRVFAQGYRIRVQLPLALGLDYDAEPDVAVVAGNPGDFRHTHPSTALLVVEVADSSLAYDRTRKGRAYAASGIPEYWIVNLADGQLEVHRQPAAGSEQSRDAFYQDVTIYRSSETVSPLSAPSAVLPVSSLLL